MRMDSENELLSEDGLARRVSAERERLGWSQEKLAREMENAGHPIHQSAISKIEKRRGRRQITVDEALGFSKVFSIPLPDLLLPPELAASRVLRQQLARAVKSSVTANAASRDYHSALQRVQVAMAENPTLRDGLMREADALRASQQGPEESHLLYALEQILDPDNPNKRVTWGPK
jgi:transcriptional regulator with XRE-family HTH domain